MKQTGYLFFYSLLLFSFSGCGSAAPTSVMIEDYYQARDIFWKNLYPYGGKTLYCQKKFDSDWKKNINIEHVFPMSWVTKSLRCGTRKQCRYNSKLFNRIEADLHNLYPSRSDINYDRQSYRFGEVQGEERRYGKDCDFEVNQKARVAEPTAAAKGEIARAMFYMAHHFKDVGLRLYKKQAKLMLTWHKADQVSKHERERNDKIERLQGNRNPFIDEPKLIDEWYKQGYFD